MAAAGVWSIDFSVGYCCLTVPVGAVSHAVELGAVVANLADWFYHDFCYFVCICAIRSIVCMCVSVLISFYNIGVVLAYH